jgi:glycerophosphoryl diester phosphodiesterase
MLKIGHRGARFYEIENTLESFKKAIEIGVDAIELDVRKSKDERLVVIHDDNLKRVFGKDYFVKDLTLKELKDLTDNKTLELKEALEFIDKKVKKILIELKEVGYEKRIIDLVKRMGLKNRVILISFHKEALKNIRKADKNIETGYIYVKDKNPIKTALELNCQYLLPFYRFTHRKNIEDAHKNNLKVIVWTINNKKEAEEFKEKGVDGIASDKPDIL